MLRKQFEYLNRNSGTSKIHLYPSNFQKTVNLYRLNISVAVPMNCKV